MSGATPPGEPPVGVLVMAYGTPASPDQLEAYYTHIRRGRPPEPTQLAELAARYAALGGTSTLARRTADQVAAIEAALASRHPDRCTVTLGQKHAEPFVEEGVAELAGRGVRRIVGVVLAPHYSGFSVGQYHQRAAAAAGDRSIDFTGVDHWYDLPAFVAHQAASLQTRLADMPSATKVVFTAHSLPERVLVGDPYPDELFAGARAIAEQAGLAPWGTWGLAWQSAGRTPEPWRGPDILTVIDDLAGSGRVDGLVVVPHGFTSDHLEVAYDLDIEAAARAHQSGMAFCRTDVVCDDPSVMGELADRVAALPGLAPAGDRT